MSSSESSRHEVYNVEMPMEFRGFNVGDIMVGAISSMLTYMMILTPMGIPDWVGMMATVAMAFGFLKLATTYRDNYPPYLVMHWMIWLRSGQYLEPAPDPVNLPLVVDPDHLRAVAEARARR